MQSHRALVKGNSIMARCRPATAAQHSPHHNSGQRIAILRDPSSTLRLHQPIAASRAMEPSIAESNDHSSGTLLPWADPYIADLHRRHEGELRRERRENS
jgi:hypothetical protein